METKFQTSFIPKKSFTGGVGAPARHHGTASLFMTIAVVLFVVSIAAAGGAYGWEQYLKTAQVTYNQQLVERQKQFNLDLIEQLKQTKVQIDAARTLITKHVALSQVFHIISLLTTEPVRFLNLDVSVPQANSTDSGIKISMHGYGKNLSVVAFQSDVLGQLETIGLRKVVKNPILSDPTLDASTPTVSFGFSATIDPASLLYTTSLNGTTSPQTQ
ncbi:MAG: hypothetical protein WCG07_02005 [Candidatus Taylorbacteria bacterium]